MILNSPLILCETSILPLISLLFIPESLHPIFKQSRCKLNHFFHWNLTTVGNPLAVKQNYAVIKSQKDIAHALVNPLQRTRFRRLLCNPVLHSFADIVKTAVAGNTLKKIILSFHVFKKGLHKFSSFLELINPRNNRAVFAGMLCLNLCKHIIHAIIMKIKSIAVDSGSFSNCLYGNFFIRHLADHFFENTLNCFFRANNARVDFLFSHNSPFLGASLTSFGSGYPPFRCRSSLLTLPAASLRWPPSAWLLSLARSQNN